jgi:hypothetical protein
MIRVGHVNAWEYPMGVFHSAVEEMEKANGDD